MPAHAPPSLFTRLLALIPVLGLAFVAPGARCFRRPGTRSQRAARQRRRRGFRRLRAAAAIQSQRTASGPGCPARHGRQRQRLRLALDQQADANGWLIVAPTIKYGDWTNPDVVAHEDPALVAWLSDYLNTVSQRTGLPIQPRVLLFGHSRGAQLALRFTEIHPDQVAGVVAISAGTYTLPVSTDARSGEALDFPYGITDLAQTDGGQNFNATSFESVPIWIGVGGADNNTADVPAAWSPYIGSTRVDSAKNFTSALQKLGADVSLTVFPNTDHTLTDAMRQKGCAELEAAVDPNA